MSLNDTINRSFCIYLTFTTLWANSADKNLKYFLFFQENSLRHFMQIVFLGDNLRIITKTCLFKYTENFTTMKMKIFR